MADRTLLRDLVLVLAPVVVAELFTTWRWRAERADDAEVDDPRKGTIWERTP